MSKPFQVYGGSTQEILSSLRSLETKLKDIRRRIQPLPEGASAAEVLAVVNEVVRALGSITTDR